MQAHRPMRMEVALWYLGASVVGNNHLLVSDTTLCNLPALIVAHVDKMPPELVATKPSAIPVARL